MECYHPLDKTIQEIMKKGGGELVNHFKPLPEPSLERIHWSQISAHKRKQMA